MSLRLNKLICCKQLLNRYQECIKFKADCAFIPPGPEPSWSSAAFWNSWILVSKSSISSASACDRLTPPGIAFLFFPITTVFAIKPSTSLLLCRHRKLEVPAICLQSHPLAASKLDEGLMQEGDARIQNMKPFSRFKHHGAAVLRSKSSERSHAGTCKTRFTKLLCVRNT